MVDFIGFRIQKRLGMFLRMKALIEGRDHSAVIRRMLTQQAIEEGYDPDGC